MKAVLLCAGKSTRTHPLTENIPKPLLKVGNISILHHTLLALKGIVSEVVLVVGFEKEQIIKEAKKIKGLKFSFVEQTKQRGTGDAVLCVHSKIKGRFFLLMGDNLYTKKDLIKLSKHSNAMLAMNVQNPENFGVLYSKKSKGKDVLKKIVEKPKKAESDLVNAGAYFLEEGIYKFLSGLKKSKRKEYEFTDALSSLSELRDIALVPSKDVISITFPWDILTANEKYVKTITKRKILGKVERGAVLKGSIIVGKGTIVKSGAYIEGPVIIGENCTIGPNCYIRAGTVIGNNSKVGNACEVKNCVVMDNVSVGHLSYMGDSVIGMNTNIGAGTITANLRHDNSNVSSAIRGSLTDSGRRKFGAIIGDHVHTGIHTSILPGRKLWPHTSTQPGEVIRKDVVK